MKKPLIGITGNPDKDFVRLFIRNNYMQAIENAGGIPVLLPLTNDKDIAHRLAGEFDGFLFSGGDDVHPMNFGEDVLPECGEISEIRDSFEINLCKAVYAKGAPIFGICRGIQSINVALNGSLYQDIPSQIKTDILHSQKLSADKLSHTVKVDKSSILYDIVKTESLYVNSFHHQSIKRKADSVSISAESDDGIIEAIEIPSYKSFFVAVQWHPEYLYKEHIAHKALFDAFINAAARYSLNR